MAKRDQISVPLSPPLRAFVQRTAEREDRTLAGQIRHFVAEAPKADIEYATLAHITAHLIRA